jgi:hypothetical protein
VKPIPATDEPAISDGQLTESGRPPSHGRVPIHAPSGMPTALPTTRPAMMPKTSGDRTAVESRSPLKSTPALASAKRGTITKLVHGWSACCNRSLGESDIVMRRAASLARAGLGRWRKARATPDAFCSAARRGG